MNKIVIHITASTEKEAEEITKHLLEKRLIACANIYPAKSMYWWEGKIVNEAEYVIDAKTTEDKFEKVVTEVEEIHSYSIPCILKIPIATNQKYSDWMNG